MLVVISIILREFSMILPASLILIPAFIMVFMDVQKYTTGFQFSTVFIILIYWGFLLDSFSSDYFLTVSFFFFAGSLTTRLFFIKIFSYTKYYAFEISMFMVGLGLSIYKIIYTDIGWIYYSQASIPGMISMVMTYQVLNNVKHLNRSNQKHTETIIGKQAPEFELHDQDGNLVNILQFREERHLLLIFVRGDWCPFCHMILRTYFKNKEKFAEKNILVMAIGPDPVGVNRKMVENLGLDYKVLSDDKLVTAIKYGIQLPDFSAPGATKHDEGMPLPASFLVDKQGIIRYTSSSSKVGEFLDPALIFPIVEKL